MKFTAIALSSALLLSACASAPGTGPAPAPIPPSIVVPVQQIQDVARTVCAFVPTAQSIITLFNSQSWVSVSEMVSAICAAFGPRQLQRRTDGTVTVNVRGVPVTGRFVQ